MSVGKTKDRFQYQMKFRSETEEECYNLSRVTEEKDLGITVDQELSFEDHIYTKINKAYRPEANLLGL